VSFSRYSLDHSRADDSHSSHENAGTGSTTETRCSSAPVLRESVSASGRAASENVEPSSGTRIRLYTLPPLSGIVFWEFVSDARSATWALVRVVAVQLGSHGRQQPAQREGPGDHATSLRRPPGAADVERIEAPRAHHDGGQLGKGVPEDRKSVV